jgi:hypothetical protein
MLEYAALVASPRALPDGLILVFQRPVRAGVILLIGKRQKFTHFAALKYSLHPISTIAPIC